MWAWDRLTQSEFDRAVEMLVEMEFGDEHVVESINGRGGDGGIDIRMRRADGALIIFQLKFFVDGFSGKRNARQRQIRESLSAALVHDPESWVLVIPSVPTRADYAFVEDLRAQCRVPIKFWHRTRLDTLLAKHPSVVNVMRRDSPLLEYATTASMEQAVLAGGGADLAARVSRLGSVVDSVDPDWTFDFAREGSRAVNVLRAKHANAATVSPISIHFSTAFSNGHQDIERQMQRLIGWGLAGDVSLPREAVRNFRVEGPPLVQHGPSEGMAISFVLPVNTAIAGTSVTMMLRSPDGSKVGSHRGVAVDGSPGTMGNSLQVLFHGAVTLTYLVPHEASGTCTLEVSYDPEAASASPSVLRRATRLLLDLGAAEVMEVAIDGSPLLEGRADRGFNVPDSDEWLKQIGDLHDLADDLDAIARATGC